MSASTYALLIESEATSPDQWEATGGVEVKGKGVMETYLWREPPGSNAQLQSAALAALPGLQCTSLWRRTAAEDDSTTSLHWMPPNVLALTAGHSVQGERGSLSGMLPATSLALTRLGTGRQPPHPAPAVDFRAVQQLLNILTVGSTASRASQNSPLPSAPGNVLQLQAQTVSQPGSDASTPLHGMAQLNAARSSMHSEAGHHQGVSTRLLRILQNPDVHRHSLPDGPRRSVASTKGSSGFGQE